MDVEQLQQEIELMKIQIQLLNAQVGINKLLMEMSFAFFMTPVVQHLEDTGKNPCGQFENHSQLASSELKRLQAEVIRLQQILSSKDK